MLLHNQIYNSDRASVNWFMEQLTRPPTVAPRFHFVVLSSFDCFRRFFSRFI